MHPIYTYFRGLFPILMKSIDKIIAGIIIAAIVLVYFATDLSFEMYSRYSNRNYSIGTYLVSLLLVSYYGFRYIHPKKASFYFGLLLSSFLLWICLLITGEKINLLYHAASGSTTATTLAIDHVARELNKGSLTGSKVFVWHNGTLIQFESSRINYFALKDKREIKAELGMAGDNTYYVSKIYWQDGAQGEAKKAYWKYWVNRYWKVPAVIIALVIFFLIIEWLRKKNIIKQRPKVWTAKATGAVFLRIMSLIAVLFLVLYLAGLLYMYVRYGGHR